MQLHLTRSLAEAGTSKMVHSHVGCLSWSNWSGRCYFSLPLFVSIITHQAFNTVAGSQEGKSQSRQPTPGSLTTVQRPLSIVQAKS